MGYLVERWKSELGLVPVVQEMAHGVLVRTYHLPIGIRDMDKSNRGIDLIVTGRQSSGIEVEVGNRSPRLC